MQKKGRHGDNGNSIYLWTESARFDQYYTGSESKRDYSKLNYIYADLTEFDLWSIQKQKISKSLVNKHIGDKIALFEKMIPEQKKILQEYSAAFNNTNYSSVIHGRVLQILNQGLIGDRTDTTYGRYMDLVTQANRQETSVKNIVGFEEIYQEALQLYKELKEYENKGYIDEKAILLFNKQFGYILGGRQQGYSSNGLTKIFKENFGNSAKDYASFKAQYAEFLVSEYFNQPPLNNLFKAVNSGGFINAGKQILEDSLVYLKSKNGTTSFNKEKTLYYTIKNTKTGKDKLMSASNWEEFEKQIKQINKAKFSIYLDDDAYDLLQKSKAMSVQTKSHRNGPESLINENQDRFSITLDEIGMNHEMLLSQLLTDYEKIESIDYEKKSKKLSLVANYFLSKNIAKTKIATNDLYFTEHGIETAAEWMHRTRRMLVFTDKEKIDTANSLLSGKSYRYGFRKVT